MKSIITWDHAVDKSVEVSKAVLLKESKHFAAILSYKQDLKVVNAHLKHPAEFEKHMLPVLVDEKLDWKGMQSNSGSELCHLTHIAEFLGMENLLSELERRMLSEMQIDSMMKLK